MHPLKAVLLALGHTAWKHKDLFFHSLVKPKIQQRLDQQASRWSAGSATPPSGPSRLLSHRALTQVAEDGCVLDGQLPDAWAKYALPKGLPQPGERRLAIENEPHRIDDYDGVIEAGYGKGTKTLLSNDEVIVKIGKNSFISKMNLHLHEADKAGLHYDLVCEGVPPGTKQWELHIPRGEYKGRYAFNQTEQGMIVTPMLDRAVRHEKPSYQLKTPEFLENLPDRYVVERKLDGSMACVSLHQQRAYLRSHREHVTQTYADKLPALEFLDNRSRFWTCRRLFPGVDLTGTELQVELMHENGAAFCSGVLNALPPKARQAQAKHGPVTAHVWDIRRFRGSDVSALPYAERRALYQQIVQEIRCFNQNWHVVESLPPACNESARDYYNYVISDPLPYGEGVVVKDLQAPAGETWHKVKARELEDFLVIEIHPSVPGTKYQNSAAWLVVEDPITHNQGKVGSFAISDRERQWIYDHREDLIGASAKIQVMEKTSNGLPRAGTFIEWHPDPRYGKVGAEMDLYSYADASAGSPDDPALVEETKYKLINRKREA